SEAGGGAGEEFGVAEEVGDADGGGVGGGESPGGEIDVDFEAGGIGAGVRNDEDGEIVAVSGVCLQRIGDAVEPAGYLCDVCVGGVRREIFEDGRVGAADAEVRFDVF